MIVWTLVKVLRLQPFEQSKLTYRGE